ncbi:MAG TPA: metal-sensitive transcriptional regulator [Chloroflexota bacterium]|nr:metal-sensitive transcriptional regulator [Chloroflexota bacterium]
MADSINQRLRKIAGQVRGIERMLDEGRSCDEVLTQLMAIRSALDGVVSQVVVHHCQECVQSMPTEEATESVGKTVRSLLKLS